jgi:NitT/TauT family transport system substrate-binding protein
VTPFAFSGAAPDHQVNDAGGTRMIAKHGRRLALAALLMTSGGAVQAAELVPVTIGVVPSVPAAATWIAVEKGYFREAGIEPQLEKIQSVSTAMALLASERMQVIEGGLAAGYWNALNQGLPVIAALERGTGPLYHDLLVRPDLKDKIKTAQDLKGRTVAVVAPGSSAIYQMGKFLETGGLTLRDIEVKYIPYSQMGLAFTNKAIEAALSDPPFNEVQVSEGLAVRWVDPEDYIKPSPVSFIGYLANTDWIGRNPDLARRFFLALVRGGRDYCQAYHHGPNRQEVEDIMWKYKAVNDRALIHTMPWQARNPNGRFNIASVEDLQAWFLKEKLITRTFPTSRLIDSSYADYAASQLPPFEVVNKDSKLAGCR